MPLTVLLILSPLILFHSTTIVGLEVCRSHRSHERVAQCNECTMLRVISSYLSLLLQGPSPACETIVLFCTSQQFSVYISLANPYRGMINPLPRSGRLEPQAKFGQVLPSAIATLYSRIRGNEVAHNYTSQVCGGACWPPHWEDIADYETWRYAKPGITHRTSTYILSKHQHCDQHHDALIHNPAEYTGTNRQSWNTASALPRCDPPYHFE